MVLRLYQHDILCDLDKQPESLNQHVKYETLSFQVKTTDT